MNLTLFTVSYQGQVPMDIEYEGSKDDTFPGLRNFD